MFRKLATVLAAASIFASMPAAAQMHYSDGYTFLKGVKDRDGTKVTDLLNTSRAAIIVNSKSADTGEGGLHIVTRGRDSTWLGFLLAKGAKPTIQDNDGNTPLGIAAQIGWVEGADTLLSRGAPVDQTNNRGETPLILAVHAHEVPMVRLLLSHGANPKRSDSAAGYSAIDYAKQDARDASILKMLEEQSAAAKPKEVAGPSL